MNWFRFYSEALDDPKVQRLPGDLFKGWINLLCLANKSRNRGMIPCVADVAFALRMDEGAAGRLIEQLVALGLVEYDAAGVLWPHNWTGRQPTATDDAAERQRQHRAKTAPAPQPPPSVTPNTNSHVTSHVTRHTLEQNRIEKDTEQSIPVPAPVLDDLNPPLAPPAPEPVDNFTPWATRCWDAYPLRNGKRLRKAEFWRGLRAIPPRQWDALEVAIGYYAASATALRGYSEDPPRFLRHWQDWMTPESTGPPVRAPAPARPPGPNAYLTELESRRAAKHAREAPR